MAPLATFPNASEWAMITVAGLGCFGVLALFFCLFLLMLIFPQMWETKGRRKRR